MSSDLVVIAEAMSALIAFSVFYSTLIVCRAQRIPYLLGVPAAFGLLTVAFLANLLAVDFGTRLGSGGLMLSVIYLLLETYGVLFLAFTYARRTRLKLIGESFSIELAIPGFVTVVVVIHAITFENIAFSYTAPPTMEISLRIVMALAAAYLTYEAARNWNLTRRAGEGAIIFAYAAMFVEQVGFVMSMWFFPDVATFLGYEGRFVALLLLTGLCWVRVGKGDFTTVIKRLGLAALAH